jgi:hypothetical protein
MLRTDPTTFGLTDLQPGLTESELAGHATDLESRLGGNATGLQPWSSTRLRDLTTRR